jgi:nucleotide-binding universal stress UspA family protein
LIFVNPHQARSSNTLSTSTSLETDMYKRILVAVDGSDTSNKALVSALQLASDTGARVCLLHSIDELALYSAMEYGSDVIIRAHEEAEKVLEDAAAIAKSAGIEADRKLMEPGMRLGDAVARAASDWKADLIVVGTHGRRGIGRALLGSGAEQVIRYAPVPVLVTRGEPPSTRA